MPFTFNAQWLFDREGNLTHAYTVGVTEKIWLPDGSLFISAGRVDLSPTDFPTTSCPRIGETRATSLGSVQR
jgi:hypothetical protein